MSQQPQSKLAAKPLAVVNSPSPEHALTNHVYLNETDAASLPAAGPSALPSKNFLLIQNFVYTYSVSDKVAAGSIALNGVQRRNLNLQLGAQVNAVPFSPSNDAIYMTHLKLEVDFMAKQKPGQKSEAYDVDTLVQTIKQQFARQFFSIGQRLPLNGGDQHLTLNVHSVRSASADFVASLAAAGKQAEATDGAEASRGLLQDATCVQLERANGSTIKLTGGAGVGVELFRGPALDPVSLGIGGLNREFVDIVRRTLISRIFPPAVVQKLGIMHVKGILLHGPPGTGKTLMARTIAKMLNCPDPKIVSGPEVFDKYVGETEKKIRELFKEAEDDYAARGDASELHIIVLDELDALCRSRGSRGDSTGVGDSAVNQLLAKIDGVNALNNILLIGMTNRLDMIDEALLRPGRMEVHIEVGLPDEEGRLQILRIHTNSMNKFGFMAPDVDLLTLAKETKNYTGAEIAGLVKSATSFALMSKIDFEHLKAPEKPEEIAITMGHFQAALRETHASFGVDETDFSRCYPNGIIQYSDRFTRVQSLLRTLIDQVRTSNRTPLVSVLLNGRSGSGKTALAVRMAVESGFPFVKLISPEELVKVGSEQGRCNKIVQAFEDAYKSPLSAIVIDDLERLLDYVPLGPRFSNAVLQTLLVLVKKVPPKAGRRLLVIGTTSETGVLRDMGLFEAFNACLDVPMIHGSSELCNVLSELEVFGKKGSPAVATSLQRAGAAFGEDGQMGIKRLIMLTELAKQFEDPLEGLLGSLAEAGLGGESAPVSVPERAAPAASTGGSALAVAVAAANGLQQTPPPSSD